MKLDSLSKIQIACFGLQYMANSIQQLKNSNQIAGIAAYADGYDDMLKGIEGKLSDLYEETANFLNTQDAICQIDIDLLERPSNILLFGMDDTENGCVNSDNV
jgi:hypothetical protein